MTPRVLDRVLTWRDRLGGLSRTGLFVASLWLIAANTPSLLPRPWWLQGLIAAICAICGYVVGLTLGGIGNLVRRWLGLRVTVDHSRARLLQGLLIAAIVLLALAFPFMTIDWQRWISTYVGQEPPGLGYPLGSSAVAVVVFAAWITLWRLVADLADWILAKVSSRIVRETVARLVASVLTVLVVVLVISYAVRPAVLAAVDRSADRVNRTTPSGRDAPTSPLRSGGPGSPYSWKSLGQDGATFVASGPDAQAITAATGRPAQEPIRVFVGVGDPIATTVTKVMGELERTKAFERKAIMVDTATSTGYLNRWGAASFEYLLDGDTAIASMAYSDLPSAFGLLTAREDPPKAARALLDAVRARLDTIPAAQRAGLYVSGESLGAYGSDSGFASIADALREVDGAVWSGTPTFATNRAELTAGRDPGSTTIVPVIDRGQHVRFAGNPAELTADEYDRPLGTWAFPRIVYLQHPSDPVSFWSPDLLFSSPKWLNESREGTPMAQMSWTPLVTFWQVTADMLVSNNVPGGFGHRYYGAEMVPTWAAVLDITDRTPAQLDKIIDAVGRK
ncbi:alpha/beta-hydrolase family protein [Arsenicicoccus piscis]|uniref:alpha/beta-hydrolase family protein n=1 Tax=Arsenicicoccus piscis TaxID=673954 RepID=UPI001F4C9FD5|nr:alpha/beta-hydrolase family protein [Arsenicicoccus piscis]MCH8627548.1 alpha/beta-hydrolase family protein [Arsenicicoccus piscis]